MDKYKTAWMITDVMLNANQESPADLKMQHKGLDLYLEFKGWSVTVGDDYIVVHHELAGSIINFNDDGPTIAEAIGEISGLDSARKYALLAAVTVSMNEAL